MIRGLLSACRHRFSWPRRGDSGDNYQVCLNCGAKYSYDWATMRRIAPLDNRPDNPEDNLDASRKSIRKCGTKKAWIPRERRLRHRVSVLFRISGSGEWTEGVTENISRSGLLFRSPTPLEAGSSLELILDLPQELTGDTASRVLCEGSLLRVESIPPARKKQQPSYQMACTITQYKFATSGEFAIPTEQNPS